MHKLFSNLLLLVGAILFTATNSFAVTKEAVTSFIKNAEHAFLSKNIAEIEKQISEEFKYSATITVDGVVYKHELNKNEFIKSTEALFKSSGIFDTYEINIKEINIQGDKAYAQASMENSFSLDNKTQKCVGNSSYEIEEIDGKLLLHKNKIAAKCQYSK